MGGCGGSRGKFKTYKPFSPTQYTNELSSLFPLRAAQDKRYTTRNRFLFARTNEMGGGHEAWRGMHASICPFDISLYRKKEHAASAKDIYEAKRRGRRALA